MHSACIKIHVEIKYPPLAFNEYFFRVDSLNPPMDCVHAAYLEKCIGYFKWEFGLLKGSWIYLIHLWTDKG